jgi:hypothetical protein
MQCPYERVEIKVECVIRHVWYSNFAILESRRWYTHGAIRISSSFGRRHHYVCNLGPIIGRTHSLRIPAWTHLSPPQHQVARPGVAVFCSYFPSTRLRVRTRRAHDSYTRPQCHRINIADRSNDKQTAACMRMKRQRPTAEDHEPPWWWWRHWYRDPCIMYSLQCSKGSRLGHDCAYQGVINYRRVFPVCPY